MKNIKESVHDDFEKLKLNKKQYFDEFYKNNYNLVYRICFSVLKNEENSEDVAQTVFEKILKMKEEQFPITHESSWLYTVAKNEAMQLIRKTKYTEPDDEFDNIQSNNNEIDSVVDNENYERIVKNLNKKQEQIVSLKIISDFTFREIGQIMSMPTATVQWHYYSSLKYLKVALSNFALFIVTLMIGLKNMWESEKIELKENNNTENTKVQRAHESSYSSYSADSIVPNSETRSVSKCTSGGEICEDSENLSVPYIGILSISGFFLSMAIIFSVLLVRHKKARKSVQKYNKE